MNKETIFTNLHSYMMERKRFCNYEYWNRRYRSDPYNTTDLFKELLPSRNTQFINTEKEILPTFSQLYKNQTIKVLSAETFRRYNSMFNKLSKKSNLVDLLNRRSELVNTVINFNVAFSTLLEYFKMLTLYIDLLPISFKNRYFSVDSYIYYQVVKSYLEYTKGNKKE